jgi:MYXO-CTERM domain-containing protein
MSGPTARRLFPLLAASAIGVLAPAPADAHYHLDAPTSWMSQDPVSNGGPQKNGPCGVVPGTNAGEVPGTPTGIVNGFPPGQPISVTVTSTIDHPGWYRIALVPGPSSTQTGASLPEPVPQAGTDCTPAIMTNPVWSPTQHVLADGLGLPPGAGPTFLQSGTKTFPVSIPQSAGCTSARPCSLQVIMVMTDHLPGMCYYHHCADVSVNGATGTGTGGTGATGTGGAGGGTAGTGGATGTGGRGGSGTGGATTLGTGGAPASGSGGATGGGQGGSTSGVDASIGAETGTDTGGCGCTVGSVSGSTGAIGLMLLLAIGRRRRRTSR